MFLSLPMDDRVSHARPLQSKGSQELHFVICNGACDMVRTVLLLSGSAKMIFKRSKIFDLVGVSGLKDTKFMLYRRDFSLGRESAREFARWNRSDGKSRSTEGKSLETQDITIKAYHLYVPDQIYSSSNDSTNIRITQPS